jgi:hypothetical protein
MFAAFIAKVMTLHIRLHPVMTNGAAVFVDEVHENVMYSCVFSRTLSIVMLGRAEKAIVKKGTYEIRREVPVSNDKSQRISLPLNMKPSATSVSVVTT